MELIPKLSLLPLLIFSSVPFRNSPGKQTGNFKSCSPAQKWRKKKEVITKHLKVAHPIIIGTRKMVDMCSRPSVVRTLMARLPLTYS